MEIPADPVQFPVPPLGAVVTVAHQTAQRFAAQRQCPAVDVVEVVHMEKVHQLKVLWTIPQSLRAGVDPTVEGHAELPRQQQRQGNEVIGRAVKPVSQRDKGHIEQGAWARNVGRAVSRLLGPAFGMVVVPEIEGIGAPAHDGIGIAGEKLFPEQKHTDFPGGLLRYALC